MAYQWFLRPGDWSEKVFNNIEELAEALDTAEPPLLAVVKVDSEQLYVRLKLLVESQATWQCWP